MKSSIIVSLLMFYCLGVYSVRSLKILAIFPSQSKSHYILGSALSKDLAARGHDVTMVSAFGEKNIPKGLKYKDVVLTGIVEDHEKRNFNPFTMFSQTSPIFMFPLINDMGNTLVEKTLNHTNMKKLLSSGEKFDIVIVEQFVNDALRVLSWYYQAPLLLYCSVNSPYVDEFFGNPGSPAYVPELSTHFPVKMTLYQRTINSLFYLVKSLNRHWLFFPQQNQIMKKYFPEAPDLSILNYNNSLVLLNSHVSVTQPLPLLPNMVEIGGHHIQPPKKLPEDLEAFIQNSTDGVIYFSMGSSIQGKMWPEEKRKVIIKVFSQLKQNILWKWEDDVLPGKPGNVRIEKWVPQHSVLAHPNVKLFITHGGMLSTTETIYFGKPILALPVFGDQLTNAANAVNNGYGLKLSFTELSEENFSEAIRELLDNSKYRENVMRRSKILHDRPIKPSDLAAYWIEYVARHHGAPHFRSAALDLAWYQVLLLDVIAVIVAVMVICIGVVYFLFKMLCCRRFKHHKD